MLTTHHTVLLTQWPLAHAQVASYGVRPRYGLVTYATVPKVLVRVSDEKSSDADWVTEKLNQISYEGQRSGKGKPGGAHWGCGGQKLGFFWRK